MKLNAEQFSVENAPQVGGRFGGETKADRARRMAQFFKNQSAGLIPLGRFLAKKIDKDGTTLADLIAKGESIEVPESITVKGHKLPLAAGQVISLKSQSWLCPACHSAHGSGLLMSKKVDVQGLQDNRWFYSVRDRKMFVISDSCYREHKVSEQKFVEASDVKALVPSPVPAKA